MAQVALDRLDVVPGSDRGDCEAVSQVMEPGFRDANRSDDTLVVLIDGVVTKMLARFIGEHQPIGIVP